MYPIYSFATTYSDVANLQSSADSYKMMGMLSGSLMLMHLQASTLKAWILEVEKEKCLQHEELICVKARLEAFEYVIFLLHIVVI